MKNEFEDFQPSPEIRDQRPGRNGEVRYMGEGRQPVHSLFGNSNPKTPLEELMEAEDQSGYSGSWVALEVLQFCFADGKPHDWRVARGRLAALIVRVLPEERTEMGEELQDALYWYRGMKLRDAKAGGKGELEWDAWKSATSMPIYKMPLDEEDMEVLMLWMCASRKRRRLREAVMRLYLLALEILPEVMVGRPDSEKNRKQKNMTLDHMAAAFGEPGNAARARWSWRAKNLLDGLPRMKWQRVKGGMPVRWVERMERMKDEG